MKIVRQAEPAGTRLDFATRHHAANSQPTTNRAKKMDFRRSGQLDERRRRVLIDEIASPADADSADETATAASGARGPVRAYSAAVLEDHQPRASDLLPVRPLAVVCWLLVGLTGIATIETIHVHAVTLPLAEGQSQLAALCASERGSLAAWYSAGLLAMASLLALLTFSIRSHRVDDYRGRYRIWLWTAGALAWLSLDAATGLHDVLGLGIALLAGKQVVTAPLAAGCTMTWIAIYGLVFGALGVRLAIEIWPSKWSAASLILAAMLYSSAALVQFEVLRAPATLIEGVLESTLAMLAHLSLLASIMLYCRHVYLDAAGRLKVHIDADRRKAKAKTRSRLKVVKAEKPEPSEKAPASPAASPAAKEPAKFGQPAATQTPPKAGATISKATVSSRADAYDDEDDDADGDDNLSRSERRRQKKMARRDQRKAA
jgi:hypothetical protein